jgi:shikimate dehydrogenase
VIDWREFANADEIQLAVLGDPIEHSLSPLMHQAALDCLGMIGKYHAIKVRFNEFEDCITHLASAGFLGVNVTIPHKEAAAQMARGDSLVDTLSFANTLRFSEGLIEAKNTDVEGFLAPIAQLLPDRALVLGAGGAAAAAVYGLRRDGWVVDIWNRSLARAEDLALKLGARVVHEPDPSNCSLVVNGTPLGLSGETPPLEWRKLAKSTTVYDMVYRRGPTQLLEAADAIGCSTIDGREMLVEQGALSFEWWLNRTAPRDIMRKAIGL